VVGKGNTIAFSFVRIAGKVMDYISGMMV